MNKMRWGLITVILYTASATAQLQVIGNNGDSLSAQPYYNALQALDTSTEQSMPQTSTVSMPHLKRSLGDTRFPVTSALTPGDVTTQPIHIPGLNRTLFVIGNDQRSIAWVQQHQTQLQAMHAIGVVTNIATADDFAQLQQQIHLPLFPASLDDLTHILPVQHYPFLIHDQRLMQ